MNQWDVKKKIGIGLASAALVLAILFVLLLNAPPTHDCAQDSLTDPEKFRAVKVVARPWLGRHEVYGIFTVPLQYRDATKYSGRISVDSYTAEFNPDYGTIQPEKDIIPEPGHYLMRGYIPTRVSLSFLFEGQFGDLRSGCNWTVEFLERRSQ